MLIVLEEVLEADPPGCVGCFGPTAGAGPVAPVTICGCVSTTVLGWRCGCIPLMVGEVKCAMCSSGRSVGHKWIPNTPQAQHLTAPVPLVGRGLVFEVLAPD